ncbi:hypothetical protein MTQ93_09745 [Staphylococcus agnetis]|uniref:hypothetical protein n=1 Tax=Staphylococcus agnetis TaxID=985762 RepID=UPI00208E83A2|nr:hypothetical protein [Staphylococcus agnetis]MCO4346327.1 hypothetical protein [Staphylococcus agnetis]MCO4360597.1 hypothetical protein [Staphylococcus agnetis]
MANRFDKEVSEKYMQEKEVDNKIVAPPKSKTKKSTKNTRIYEEDWYKLKVESAKEGKKIIDVCHEAVQAYFENKKG